MRVIISVIGKDMVGILAKVSGICFECNVNITEVTQSVLQDVFAMTMLGDISKSNTSFEDFSNRMSSVGSEFGLSVRVMHEDIFNSMHRI